MVYLGVEYRSVHNGERLGFTVKPTAKYVDECLDTVQLQNAKAVMTIVAVLGNTVQTPEKPGRHVVNDNKMQSANKQSQGTTNVLSNIACVS